ncbi:MAG: hypothetical protein R3C25_03315 [Hyphomonadaceae bacterium]
MRPITPTALGVFFLLSTALTAAVAISLAAPGGALDAMWALKPGAHEQLLDLRPASTLGFAALSLAMAATAYGVARRRAWGWRSALAIFAINGLGDGARAATGAWAEGLLGAAIAAAILWWLMRPPVRALFSR